MEPLQLYLKDLREIRATGAGVPEESYYGALESLLNAVGSTLDPKVRAVPQVTDTGAGHPDYGFYTADQYQSFSETGPLEGQLPERGVVEVKAVGDDAWLTADGEQVTRYWGRYGLVLVTNFRDFLLVGRNAEGQQRKLEAYHLAENEAAFWELAAHPRSAARAQGERFAGFIKRVLLHEALLSRPEDVAWFLASYAREALARMEGARGATLDLLRKALGDALDMKFEGEQGEHFFRSSLIQTLFYGIFSAWVIWNRHHPPAHDAPPFDWMHAASYLRVPIVRKLFHEIAEPGQLRELGLIQALDWAGMALNRVDRADFFGRFEQEEAVQYFYEPFLEAYDPDLRKQLGVWYTPREVILYMVERVDRVLREELDIEDGLADSRVYVLDPCCGTGGYLVAVLDRIARTLREKSEDALRASDIKQAAQERVFGFEILPAPYVVAHMQLGLRLEELGAPLAADERPGIYLTNALTGWEPPTAPKTRLLWRELEQERDAAEKVKREEPILVVLGNPPYNAFAGTTTEEEGDLAEAYKGAYYIEKARKAGPPKRMRRYRLTDPPSRGGWGIRKFNLDDMYVRFFRIAQRRIVKSGRGILCYISNFSYLGEPSFVVMRQCLLEAFGRIWIDCMNGSSRETGKRTPEGEADPSVFSTEASPAGIQVGTAICLMAKKQPAEDEPDVRFRHFWGVDKRLKLLQSLDVTDPVPTYVAVQPTQENRYSLRALDVRAEYSAWPKVTELAATKPYGGPIERRGGSLVFLPEQAAAVIAALESYLDPDVPDREVESLEPRFMKSSGEFDAGRARADLKGAVIAEESNITVYAYKPMDMRRAYLDEALAPLFSRPSPELLDTRRLIQANAFLVTRDTADKSPEGAPFMFSKTICDYDCLSGHARHFPVWVLQEPGLAMGARANTVQKRDGTKLVVVANCSSNTHEYLTRLGYQDPDFSPGAAHAVWDHTLAIGFAPAYLTENGDGVKVGWPRVPLPDAKDLLDASAELGWWIAALLDPEQPASGVTSGTIHPELGCIGNITHVEGRQLDPSAGDLLVTADWGYPGAANATMPGAGKAVERDYAEDEGETPRELGETTLDVYVNDEVYWKNIPQRVWDYHIGGYQVLKKWLSYRDNRVLGRSLTADEARFVTEMARRIAAILLMEPELDANYNAVKENTYPWPGRSPQ